MQKKLACVETIKLSRNALTMTTPVREPLIEVKDLLPEPPKTGAYTPSWPTATPEDVLSAANGKEAEAAVNRHIRAAANARLTKTQPTVRSADANREEVWATNKAATKKVMARLWPKKTGKKGKRLKTLFSGQWADVPLEEFVAFAKDAGFEGVELACWHFDVQRALVDDAYVAWIKAIFEKYEMQLVAISSHLVGQCVLDRIDERHASILFAAKHVWGDGNPHGVNLRAAQEMMDTAAVARRLDVNVISGFTGSSIWHLVYDFPPAPGKMIDAGFDLLADRWNPILDVFAEFGEVFALEVHPTEIAFDVYTAERACKALDYRSEFGFNYDPSHLIWQGVDPTELIKHFPDRMYHVHMKDAFARIGRIGSVLGSFLPFGHPDRGFDFVSLGRGDVDFTAIIRALNAAEYYGPLSNEWEDSGMNRTEGAREASDFITRIDFGKSARRMDQAFGGDQAVAAPPPNAA